MGGSQMSRYHISISDLCVRYSEPVLEKVFLQLRKGEIVSIVGKSGCGKTTLLHALAGLVPFEGEIHKPKQTTLIFQQHTLFPWMNVEQNIAFATNEKEIGSIQKTISMIGLDGKETAYPHQLSGGQCQRVAIGRSLAAKPEALLLDEPFASLDYYTRLQMQHWINELLEKNQITALLVTHDVDEAILLSDRILIMKNKTLENEFVVPFNRPRNEDVRYSKDFQELKRKIISQY